MGNRQQQSTLPGVSPRTIRSSFTLPPDVKADLAAVSKLMRVSQSGLLAALLSEPLRDLRDLLEGLPPEMTPEDMVRFRGKSRAVVYDRIRAMESEMDGLLVGKPSE